MNDDRQVRPPRFTVTLGTFRGVHEVRLAGELDIVTAARLRDVLVSLPGPAIVVDLSDLEFIDAAGLSALVLAIRHHEGNGEPGRQLAVRGAHGLVRRVIEVGGLSGLLVDAAA